MIKLLSYSPNGDLIKTSMYIMQHAFKEIKSIAGNRKLAFMPISLLEPDFKYEDHKYTLPTIGIGDSKGELLVTCELVHAEFNSDRSVPKGNNDNCIDITIRCGDNELWLNLIIDQLELNNKRKSEGLFEYAVAGIPGEVTLYMSYKTRGALDASFELYLNGVTTMDGLTISGTKYIGREYLNEDDTLAEVSE